MRRLIHKTASVWTKEEGAALLLPLLVASIFVAPLLRDWFPVLAALGTAWAYAYDLLEVVRPGSFQAARSVTEGSYPPLLYYSFVTLTTVGYGDVTPLSSAARALSNLESLIGVLFPAVLIGRLLSKQVAGRPPEPPAPG